MKLTKPERNVDQVKRTEGNQRSTRTRKRREVSPEQSQPRQTSFVTSSDTSQVIPAWLDCTWKRVACGRDDCPMCGRMNRDYDRHVANGEDPDDPQVMMEDVAEALRDTVVMIRKHAAEMDIDLSTIEDVEDVEPPAPKTFSVYRFVWAWKEALDCAMNEAELNGAFWPYTEDAEDLNWYKNTLCTKVYRQLCNRWRMERGEDAITDYEYTHRVLHGCCTVVRRALTRIASPEDALRSSAAELLKRLNQLEEKVLSI